VLVLRDMARNVSLNLKSLMASFTIFRELTIDIVER